MMKHFVRYIALFSCILTTFDCARKTDSTPIQDVVSDNMQAVSVVEQKTIAMRLTGSDTITRPVGEVEVIIINHTDSTYTTGQYYKIERLCDSTWTEVPLKYGTFEDIGYVLGRKGGARSFTINLKNVKHTYEEGIYRICKWVSNDAVRQELHCEFYVR